MLVYCKTHLEEYIESLYKKLDIDSPDQAHYVEIGRRLNITVKDHPDKSTCLRIGPVSYILLNNKLNEQQKWQEFAHELCHLLRHAGNQEALPFPFVQLQEWQAKSFAYHFCIPTFMLNNMTFPPHEETAAFMISEFFNVEYDFALERLRRWILQKAVVQYS